MSDIDFINLFLKRIDEQYAHFMEYIGVKQMKLYNGDAFSPDGEFPIIKLANISESLTITLNYFKIDDLKNLRCLKLGVKNLGFKALRFILNDKEVNIEFDGIYTNLFSLFELINSVEPHVIASKE